MVRPALPVASIMVIGGALALAGCGAGSGPSENAAVGQGSAAPQAFVLCAACHNVEQSEQHSAGPNLHGIMGRKAGSAEGFSYSPAMRKSGLTWTPEALDQFLQAPAKVIPGTRMMTAVDDPKQRAIIIDYLTDKD
jgi:cytochrome c